MLPNWSNGTACRHVWLWVNNSRIDIHRASIRLLGEIKPASWCKLWSEMYHNNFIAAKLSSTSMKFRWRRCPCKYSIIYIQDGLLVSDQITKEEMRTMSIICFLSGGNLLCVDSPLHNAAIYTFSSSNSTASYSFYSSSFYYYSYSYFKFFFKKKTRIYRKRYSIKGKIKDGRKEI